MYKKSSVLILLVFVTIIFTILSGAMVSRSISENNLVQRYSNSARAFWAAEAGVNQVLYELREDFDVSADSIEIAPFPADGDVVVGYAVDSIVEGATTKSRNVTVYGCAPYSSGCPNPDTDPPPDIPGYMRREIEITITKDIPSNFYENAIYSAGDVDFNGAAYTVVNNEAPPDDIALIYSGENDIENEEQITGEIIQDTSISPLPRLDFEELFDISEKQNAVYPDTGNVYDVGGGGKLIDPITEEDKALPASFWYTTTGDGEDNDGDGDIDEEDEGEWVPNVVYIRGDLKINGQIGTVGGFFVVVGDVLTNPEGEDYEDATIVGEGQIDGVIYTLGELNVNGGGTNGLDINGGVWSGEGVTINGSADVLYNANYMSAIGSLDIEPTAQVADWRDNQNPYPLLP